MQDGFIDLHTHSNCSDGSMSPSQLVLHAAEKGLAAIALTDHDTVDGIKEAVAKGKECGIEVVPAIEFSARSKTLTHILGFYVDEDNAQLRYVLGEIVDLRRERNAMTAKNLQQLGFDVSLEEAADAICEGLFRFLKVIGKKLFFRVDCFSLIICMLHISSMGAASSNRYI